MIEAVAFCPHPPLLIPQVAQGAAAELDDLRAACREAIRRVAAGRQLVVIGAGERWRQHDPMARGSLAPFGVALEIPLGSDDPGPVELPLSLTVGAWLLRDALGPNCGAHGWTVAADDEGDPGPAADGDRATALIVMADGSARRSTSAPGYYDERAADFDAGIAAALRSGAADLLHLQEDLARDLLVEGTAAWDVAARLLEGGTWQAELRYDAAPYGVAYFVAVWTLRA